MNQSQQIIEAIRTTLSPDVLDRLKALAPGRKVKKIEQSRIVSILRKAGLQAAIRSPIRNRRAGFTVQLVQNKFVMVITWEDPTGKQPKDWWKELAKKSEKAVEAAGFKTTHPHDLTTDMLLVVEPGSPE